VRYLLDTNICIYLMKRHPAEVLARLEDLYYGEAVISAITLAELRAGLDANPQTRERNETALQALLQDLPVLPFGPAAAVSYGPIRAAIRDRRRDALDRLIAAHAVSLGITLVTNNEDDFRDYPGLSVENWVAAPH
jgi:tRNA(fMet)-specific endonuclease VapC